MYSIDSPENPKYKMALSLKQKKSRQNLNLFLIEGLRNIQLAREFGHPLKYLFIDKNHSQDREYITLLESYEDRAYFLPVKLIDNLSETVTPQGIVAVAEISKFEFSDAFKEKSILILDRIQDPGNFGSIIRSADASGIRYIFYLKGTVDLYSPKVVRSAMGSLFYMNIREADMDMIQILKDQGFKLISSSLENAVSYNSLLDHEKIALVIGNEANGISKDIISISDTCVKIPLLGKAESLNAAAAAAVLMYKMAERNL